MLARLKLVPIDATATPEFVHRVTRAVKAGLLIAGGEQPIVTDVPLLTVDEFPDEAGPPFPEARRSADRAALDQLSAETGRPVSEMEEEAAGYLSELVAEPSTLFVDLRARLEQALLEQREVHLTYDPGARRPLSTQVLAWGAIRR